MPESKDMLGQVVILAGKIYGPGEVTAPTLPQVIKDIPTLEPYNDPEQDGDFYTGIEYDPPATLPPAYPSKKT